MKKVVGGILLFIFDLGMMASDLLYPLNLVIALLDPFISDELWSVLSTISWILTFAIFAYYIEKWVFGLGSTVEDDEELNRERAQLKKRFS